MSATYHDAERKRVVAVFETIGRIIFGVIRLIIWAAPLGAFGGMAYTVSVFGSGALANLGLLMITFWTTCAIFVFGVLGLVAKLSGFSIVRFIRLIRDEHGHPDRLQLQSRRHLHLPDARRAVHRAGVGVSPAPAWSR